MTNLTNIKRDSFWVDPEASKLNVLPSPGFVPVTDGQVHLTHASAWCAEQVGAPVGQTLIGVWMPGPVEEPVPYRVKAQGTYKVGGSTPNSDDTVYWGFGYGDGPDAGTTVGNPWIFSNKEGTFDEVLMVRKPNSGTENPLCFWIGLIGSSHEAYANFSISVQKMDKGFDPFSTAIY